MNPRYNQIAATGVVILGALPTLSKAIYPIWGDDSLAYDREVNQPHVSRTNAITGAVTISELMVPSEAPQLTIQEFFDLLPSQQLVESERGQVRKGESFEPHWDY